MPQQKKESTEVLKDGVERVLGDIERLKLKIVNISRVNRDMLREKLRRFGLSNSSIYNVHDGLSDGLKSDDFLYVLDMIKSYFEVEEEEMILLCKEEKDVKDGKNWGIDEIDFSEEEVRL